MGSRNLIMDAGEFGIGQVKKEVDNNDFDEALDEDGTYRYQDQNEANKSSQIYVDQSKCSENSSTCNPVQIKNENDPDTIYKDIKREIVEENVIEVYGFCRVCNNFSSETDFIKSTNERVECSCQEENFSINQQGEDMTQDVKPSLLGFTTDSVLKLVKVKDETISGYEYDEKQVSLAAPRRDSVPLLENDKMLTPTNIPDDLLLSKRKCRSMSVENDLFMKPQVTDTAEKKFQCKFCSKSFIEMIDLKVHKWIGHLDDTFDCKICSRSFTHIGSLKKHKASHAKYSHQCQTCKKTFSSKHKLIYHKATHSEKEFHSHEKIHCEREKLHCKICSRAFSTPWTLKQHEIIHSRKEPFTCKICSHPFCKLSSLKTHEKIHEKATSFPCKICTKSFCKLSGLKTHERIHTK